jgi:hypothetical protein
VLEGTGKLLRYITLRTPTDVKSAALKAVLREAFALAEAARDRTISDVGNGALRHSPG